MAEPLTPDMAVLDAARAFVHAWETGVDTTDEYAALLDAARAAAPSGESVNVMPENEGPFDRPGWPAPDRAGSSKSSGER